MKNLYLIITFLILSFSIKAQTTIPLDSLIEIYVNDLHSDKTDTICIYQDYCVGYIDNSEIHGKCKYYPVFKQFYVLWIKQGITYMNKKDNCYDYTVIEINTDSIWDKVFYYKDKLKKEKVKKFEYLEKNETYTMIRDHSCHRDFKIIINNEIISMKFNDFDILENEDNHNNINYLYNNNLKGKIIVDGIERLVKKIEEEKAWEKILR
jgi:hypothetical protein